MVSGFRRTRSTRDRCRTGGEEHCPLCIAMHSALPVAAHIDALHLTLVECKVVQALNHAPETQWHFAMFSRPPPVKTL